jgi:hypothetical protein
MAGRLLLDELRHNVRFLEIVAKREGEVPVEAKPRRSAWEGVGTAFLRLADHELAKAVSAAYLTTETVSATVGYLKHAHDDALGRLEDLKTSVQGRLNEATAEDAEELQRLIGAVTRLGDDLRGYLLEVRGRELPFLRDEVVPAVDQRVYPRSRLRRMLR